MSQPMPHYSIREWESRRIGEQDGGIPLAHALALSQAAAKHDRNAMPTKPRQDWHDDPGRSIDTHGRFALSLSHDQLQARAYIGQISAGSCSMEILPKIGGIDGETAIRARLIQMLGVATGINILSGAIAGHGHQNETLLDILIRLFASALLEQVRRGLPRAYIGQQEDLSALRGRLNVIRQFSSLAAAPQRLACHFDELSFDIPLNQIMGATVRGLRPLAKTLATTRLLDEIAFAYADILLPRITNLPWHQVRFDRSNTRWQNLFSLARLLMRQVWQTTGNGETDGTALLFDMNSLFEGYVAANLVGALPRGWRATMQGGARFCLTNSQTGTSHFQTKPDILIHQGNQIRLVIDTKWKSLLPQSEDRNRGISQADIYQMMAYASLYEADVLLLYPWHSRCGGAPAEIIDRHEIANGNGRIIMIACVDISKSTVPNQIRSLLELSMGATCST